MTFTSSRPNLNGSLQDTVMPVVSAFQALSVDEQLGLLWTFIAHVGPSLTRAVPGAARFSLIEGLLDQIRCMSHPQQLQMMRDLASGANTPMTRAYGVFSTTTKLAFWIQMMAWMRSGEVAPVRENEPLPLAASAVFDQLITLDFAQQMTVLRRVVVAMGVDPLAVRGS